MNVPNLWYVLVCVPLHKTYIPRPNVWYITLYCIYSTVCTCVHLQRTNGIYMAVIQVYKPTGFHFYSWNTRVEAMV